MRRLAINSLFLYFLFTVVGVNLCAKVLPGGDGSEYDSTFPASWHIPDKYAAPLEKIADNLYFLHDQRIKARSSRINTTMNVRPTLGSLLFRSRENRKYIIRVNNRDDFDGVYYHDVPLNAQVGLWAHEMMHIKDFSERGFFGVLARGWQYLSKRGKMRFEHEIDQMVINAGFRHYLFLWATFVLDESEASDSYKDYKRKIYLSPADILIDLDDDGLLDESTGYL